jgi:hypothetical protein
MTTQPEKVTKRIKDKALELLEQFPQGLRYSELRAKISAFDPSFNPNTIRHSIWNLDAIFPDKVYKPSKGLFRLLKHKQAELETGPSVAEITPEELYHSLVEMHPPPGPPKEARKVIILGAGASRADGAPLQSQLFPKYAEIIKDRARSGALRPADQALCDFFQEFWGAGITGPDPDEVPFPTFEEALGLLELANARGEFFKGFGSLPHRTSPAHKIHDHLIGLIATVLDHTLRGSNRNHSALARSLARLHWFSNTSFISLNYDLLIDSALREALNVEPDYALMFRSVGNALGGGTHTWKPPMLKIHGSLNWLYCPTCNAVDLFPGEKIVVELAHNAQHLTCHTCQEPRLPIVIPPTFFKVMSNFYLQQIWKRAEDVLRQADHLIFCGYSFPDADLHFKYLLKRAEINRASAPTAPTHLPLLEFHSDEDHQPEHLEVFIINEHPGKTPDARQAERDRYFRFFRDKSRVHWTTLTFEAFANNPAAYANPANWT